MPDLETKTNGNGQTLYEGPGMDWWSAGDFCAAHGKALVSYTTLSQAPYNCSGSTSARRCDFAVFRNMGLLDAYWTGEDYGNSCNAWYVDVYDGTSEHIFGRDDNYYQALCE